MRNQKVNAQIYTKAHAKNKISTWMFEIQTMRKNHAHGGMYCALIWKN